MRKHVAMPLDMTLVSDAAKVLGTEGINETIDAALRDVLASRKRLGLLDLDPDLTLERLGRDRAGRVSATGRAARRG